MHWHHIMIQNQQRRKRAMTSQVKKSKLYRDSFILCCAKNFKPIYFPITTTLSNTYFISLRWKQAALAQLHCLSSVYIGRHIMCLITFYCGYVVIRMQPHPDILCSGREMVSRRFHAVRLWLGHPTPLHTHIRSTLGIYNVFHHLFLLGSLVIRMQHHSEICWVSLSGSRRFC